MYSKNKLFRSLADGEITPATLVDIILGLQEENSQLRRGIDLRNNPYEVKNMCNCRIAIVDNDKLIKSFGVNLASVPNEGEKIILNTENGSVAFIVTDVVRDITIKKNKVTEINNIYVKRIGGK